MLEYRKDDDIVSAEKREVCCMCCKVLAKYLDGDSRKNENYLARYTKLFQEQVSLLHSYYFMYDLC